MQVGIGVHGGNQGRAQIGGQVGSGDINRGVNRVEGTSGLRLHWD